MKTCILIASLILNIVLTIVLYSLNDIYKLFNNNIKALDNDLTVMVQYADQNNIKVQAIQNFNKQTQIKTIKFLERR